MVQKALQWIITNWESITGFFLAMWGGIKGGVMIYKRLRKWYLLIVDFVKSVNKLIVDVVEIKKGVLPNGGKSLDDKISRIAEMVEIIGGRQSAMLHEVPTPMYECDPDGYLIDVNRAWCELTGLEKYDALGEGWKKIIYKDDFERVQEIGQDYAESGVNFNDTFRMQNYRTKEIFEVQATSTKCFNKSGEVILILGAVKKVMSKEEIAKLQMICGAVAGLAEITPAAKIRLQEIENKIISLITKKQNNENSRTF
jgi:PAS domain S-box-containing protein